MSKETFDEGKEDEEEMFGAVLGTGRFLDKGGKNEVKENLIRKNRMGEEKNEKRVRALDIEGCWRESTGNDREKVKKKVEEEKGDKGKKKVAGERITDVYFEVFSKIPRDKEYAFW